MADTTGKDLALAKSHDLSGAKSDRTLSEDTKRKSMDSSGSEGSKKRKRNPVIKINIDKA